MIRFAGFGSTLPLGALALALLAGCTEKVVVSDAQNSVTACDQGRPSKFVVAPREKGATAAVAGAAGDYYMFEFNPIEAKVRQVDATGNTLGVYGIASDLGPSVNNIAPTPDGGLMLGGSVESLSGGAPWVGKVDAQWQLEWERTFDSSLPGEMQIVLLPDGGAIVGSVSSVVDWAGNTKGVAPPAISNVWAARLDASGNLAWQRTFWNSPPDWTADNVARVFLTEDRVRIIFVAHDAITWIETAFTGTTSTRRLDTTLALDPQDAVALPDGRLAIASSRQANAVMTMVSPDGSVEWEKTYGGGQDANPQTISYNRARDEILLGGDYRGADGGTSRTWIIATDLDGNQTWQLVRAPMAENLDGQVAAATRGRGPMISDIATQPDGSFIAPCWTTDLSFFIVGADACTP